MAEGDGGTEGEGRLDRIELRGIVAAGRHGAWPDERLHEQPFVADVVVHLDTRRAAAGDDLTETVDYGVLAEQVAAVLAGEPVDLLETLAERVAATALAHPRARAVDVSVHKPQAPLAVSVADVLVSIHRDRTRLPAAEPLASAQPRPASTGARRVTSTLPDVPDVLPVPEALPAPDVPTPSVADGTDAVAVAPEPAPEPPVLGRPDTDPDVAAPPAADLPPAVSWIPTPEQAAAAVAGGLVVAPLVPPWPRRDELAADLPPAAAALAPEPVVAPPPAELRPAEPTPLEPVEVEPVAVAPVAAEPDPDEALLDRLPPVLADVVLSLGGNLGPAKDTLRWAVQRLRATPGLEVTGVAPLARTAAVDVTGQPDFLNTVVLVRTLLPPRELLHRLQAIEDEAGRQRTQRWGPRTLDIDIVAYGTLAVATDELELPHPRAHQRAFVLQPWAALDPHAVLPGLGGGPVAALAATAPDASGVRWLALDWLDEPEHTSDPRTV